MDVASETVRRAGSVLLWLTRASVLLGGLGASRPAQAEEPPPVEVVVQGEKAEPGGSTLTRAEVRQIPGAFGDPFRAIEALPGVTPIVSGVPFFYVRGAPPGNVGYFLDAFASADDTYGNADGEVTLAELGDVPLAVLASGGSYTDAPSDWLTLADYVYDGLFRRVVDANALEEEVFPNDRNPH